MPTDVVFDTYLDHLAQLYWPTSNVECAIFLKDTWTPAKSDAFVADAIGAGAIECAAVGYVRVALTSPTLVLDGGGHRELFHAAVADFGALAAGTDFDTLLLYELVTNDADSWPLAAYDVGMQTTSGTGTRFVPDTSGLFKLDQP